MNDCIECSLKSWLDVKEDEAVTLLTERQIERAVEKYTNSRKLRLVVVTGGRIPSTVYVFWKLLKAKAVTSDCLFVLYKNVKAEITHLREFQHVSLGDGEAVIVKNDGTLTPGRMPSMRDLWGDTTCR